MYSVAHGMWYGKAFKQTEVSQINTCSEFESAVLVAAAEGFNPVEAVFSSDYSRALGVRTNSMLISFVTFFAILSSVSQFLGLEKSITGLEPIPCL